MNERNIKDLKLNDYPIKTYDKIRYRDTDRQGHVNNAVFSTFLETGRVELLFNPDNPLANNSSSFVIASLKLDLLSEIKWPGIVDIGTAIINIGNSSIRIVQGLYYNNNIVATAETVIVQIDEETKRSKPLTQDVKDILNQYILNV